MPICENCGTGLPVGHKFCYECGFAVGGSRPPVFVDTPQPPAPSRQAEPQSEGWETAGFGELPAPPATGGGGDETSGVAPGPAPDGSWLAPSGAYPQHPGAYPPPYHPGGFQSPYAGSVPPRADITRPLRLGGSEAGKQLEFLPESWGMRTLAALIDAFVVFIPFVVGMAVLLIASGRIDPADQGTSGGGDAFNPYDFSLGEQLAFTAALVGVFYLVQVVEEGLFGTTLGKLAFRLRVVDGEGRRCGLGRAAVRNLVKAPAIALSPLFTPAAFLVFFLPVRADRERRRSVGDRMAGTLVGKRVDPADRVPGWGGAPYGGGPSGGGPSGGW
jgi:uncharacterized RDD family membrane protein YckC